MLHMVPETAVFEYIEVDSTGQQNSNSVYPFQNQHIKQKGQPVDSSWRTSTFRPYVQEFQGSDQSANSPMTLVESSHRRRNSSKASDIDKMDISQLPFFRSQVMRNDGLYTRSKQLQTESSGQSRKTNKSITTRKSRADRENEQTYLHRQETSTMTTNLCQITSSAKLSSIFTQSEIANNLRPAHPERLQSGLLNLRPTVVYAEYDCVQRCRSVGICVHYSFLLGCQEVPDGLVCEICKMARAEMGYPSGRLCYSHSRKSASQSILNLAEDFAATEHQREVAGTIMSKALCNTWEEKSIIRYGKTVLDRDIPGNPPITEGELMTSSFAYGSTGRPIKRIKTDDYSGNSNSTETTVDVAMLQDGLWDFSWQQDQTHTKCT